MFTRRHPYLFFLLMMGAMATAGMFFLSMMVVSFSGEAIDYSGDKVGVVEIIGAISDSKAIIDQIKTFRERDSVKAIVIRVDSPGGGVGPSQEIYREIRKTTEKKKVIISMGGLAASGGYYVAAAGDGIVANPGTITGSIGVIMGYTNFEELMSKIGLIPVVIKSGEYKDIGSPLRKMTAEEKELLQDVTQTIHRQFTSDIAEGRKMEIEQVQAIADGRIFTGEDAQKMGLVDRLGNLQDAVQWAGELAGMTGEIETIYPEKKKDSLVQYLTESLLNIWAETKTGRGLAPEAILR